ncbi:MAG: NUDIX hydrolase [Oscillospiraceae bacterium]|nr:NUDIX hydrolase [Oscillospiraceae bacterium]
MYIEKEIQRNTVHRGRIVNVRSDIAEIHGGKHVSREVVEHPGGVCVVPIDHDNTCWCVRQFRYPFQTELLEFPAGKLDRSGEEPRACAIRELKEETGLTAGRLIDLGPMYPSPGYLDEILHLYLALDLEKGPANLDEDEYLSVEQIPIDALLAMIAENNLPDAKTMVGLFKAIQYLKHTAEDM